jgi:hypothetical protein
VGVTRDILLPDQAEKHVAHKMLPQSSGKKHDILATDRSHVKHLTIL